MPTWVCGGGPSPVSPCGRELRSAALHQRGLRLLQLRPHQRQPLPPSRPRPPTTTSIAARRASTRSISALVRSRCAISPSASTPPIWGGYTKYVTNTYSDAYVNTLQRTYTAEVRSYKLDFRTAIHAAPQRQGPGHAGSDLQCGTLSQRRPRALRHQEQLPVGRGRHDPLPYLQRPRPAPYLRRGSGL